MIDRKRIDLETFIREQTIGPGIAKSRFRDLSQGAEEPSSADQEIIDINPGGVYSTGILFPVDATRGASADSDAGSGSSDTSNDVNVNTAGSTEDPIDEEEEKEKEDESVLDQQSLNQMYPNAMGLTVCLHRNVSKDKDLRITIEGRYYHKLPLATAPHRIGVLLEQDLLTFEALRATLPVDDILRRDIQIETVDDKNYISLLHGVGSIIGMKTRLFDLKRHHYDTIRAALTDLQHNPGSLENLKEHLFQQLQKERIPSSDEGQATIRILERIESLESSFAHIMDLINIHEARGYGAWRCESFEIPLAHTPPEVTRPKQIHTFRSDPELADVYRHDYAEDRTASLGVNLQYSRYANRDDDRIYLKIQLLNTSTPFSDDDTRGGRNYFSLASEAVNKRCFFGVGIRVESPHLIPYRRSTVKQKSVYDQDDISQYIYRQYEDYGQGHGCSVKWDIKGDVRTVSTEYLPHCDTPDIDPIPRHRERFVLDKHPEDHIAAEVFEDTSFLQFKWLSTLSSASDVEIINALKQLVNGYETWIDGQVDPSATAISTQIRQSCTADKERIRKNIDHLSENLQDLTCFRMMNTAMFMQIWHKERRSAMPAFMAEADFTAFSEPFYRTKADDRLYSTTEHAAWRPFQLAFILLNIDGVFQRKDDIQWSSRDQWVDLVWFPTGGGKTEAYLGLIGMTIIHRRIAFGPRGGGVAAIMRYTLRLLTAQQFQRATMLIMALELMRRWDPGQLGEEPIYIGLYVGIGSLPNKLTGVKGSLLDEYDKLRDAQRTGKRISTKVLITECPWCGQKLDPVKYELVDDRSRVFQYGRILLSCSDPAKKCAFFDRPLVTSTSKKFQGPIPVSLCDEEIYQHPPALLFGTVDKFAQLAHKVSNQADKTNADSRRLFGKGNWEPGKPTNGYITPDLIIQDELHLMMGPLGSAVALFESAVDQLCYREQNGLMIRPKVISSTATTRNTELQIMALFDRKVNLFPKPGIHCDDSFFAFYRRSGSDEQGNGSVYISKRRYIGVLPTGRTQMWMQLRLAAILFTHRAIFEGERLGERSSTDPSAYDKDLRRAMDHYHTALAYFNSLREVGKTESQIFTYLIKETRRVFNKALRPSKLMQCYHTYASSFRNGELTGRLNGEQIVEQMRRASTAWLPEKRLAHPDPKGGQPLKGTTPPDLVIATNMISVGIDISRFNSMIMNCMPRNIAEYIQASSRVARDTKGLVITVHHPFRTRDLSHYERFIDFHEKMYSYVEPISITPFTHKALERYLPLYIAVMIRHTIDGFADRDSANVPLTDDMKRTIISQLTTTFDRREAKLRGEDSVQQAVKQLLTIDNLTDINMLTDLSIEAWRTACNKAHALGRQLMFTNKWIDPKSTQEQLYVDVDEFEDNIHSELWRIPQSLRVVDPEAIIHINQK